LRTGDKIPDSHSIKRGARDPLGLGGRSKGGKVRGWRLRVQYAFFRNGKTNEVKGRRNGRKGGRAVAIAGGSAEIRGEKGKITYPLRKKSTTRNMGARN